MPRPDSLPWMESADAKLASASTHLTAFRSGADKYLKDARPKFIRKTSLAETEHWLVFYVEDSIPPIELSTIMGDILYNLRSALDSLICGLVHTRRPHARCRGSFPIQDDPEVYREVRREALRGVPKEARLIVDGLQPFCRPENSRQLDPFWILNALCNRDKHQSALFTLCYHRNVQLLIPRKDGSGVYVKLPRNVYAGDPGTVPLPGPPSAVEDPVAIKIMGKSVLTFREDGPWVDRSVEDVLDTCLRYVEDRVIPRFVPFFK